MLRKAGGEKGYGKLIEVVNKVEFVDGIRKDAWLCDLKYLTITSEFVYTFQRIYFL